MKIFARHPSGVHDSWVFTMHRYFSLTLFIVISLSFASGDFTDVINDDLFDDDDLQNPYVQNLMQDPNFNTDVFSTFGIDESNTDLFADCFLLCSNWDWRLPESISHSLQPRSVGSASSRLFQPSLRISRWNDRGILLWFRISVWKLVDAPSIRLVLRNRGARKVTVRWGTRFTMATNSSLKTQKAPCRSMTIAANRRITT